MVGAMMYGQRHLRRQANIYGLPLFCIILVFTFKLNQTTTIYYACTNVHTYIHLYVYLCLPFCRAISRNEPVPDLSDTFFLFPPGHTYTYRFDAIFIKLSKLGSAFHLCLFLCRFHAHHFFFLFFFWHCKVLWHIKSKSLNSLQLTAGLWGNSRKWWQRRRIKGESTNLCGQRPKKKTATVVLKSGGRMFGHIKHTHCCAPHFPFPTNVKN